MMDLNMRLQVSASKAQVKAIDLELGKMEAQQSLEHLTIVQLFLPDTFRSEHDSVQALLRLRRIGFKANMMHHFVKDRMQSSGAPGQEDDLFACCEVLDKLTWVASTCDRFINNIQTCNLEAFRRLGGASYELEPVERAFNVWIDGLKRDDLKVGQCATELQRYVHESQFVFIPTNQSTDLLHLWSILPKSTLAKTWSTMLTMSICVHC
jgi:dynactin 1